MRIAVVRDVAEIEALRHEWDHLLNESEAPSVYSSYPFVMASWQYFDAHQSVPQVIVVREGAELVGLAPFRLRRRRIGLVPETVLEYLGSSQGDRPSVLIRPGAEAQVWGQLLELIPTLKWDRWIVPEIEVKSEAHQAIVKDLSGAMNVRCEAEDQGQALVTDLSGSWDAFLAKQKELRRNLRALERKMPEYQVDRFVTPATIDAGLDLYEKVAATTWKVGKVGILKSEKVRQFYRLVAPMLVADGFSGVRVVRQGDDLIAAHMGFMYGPTVFSHSIDFDPAHRALSPGMLAVALAIRDFFDSPADRIDYLTGYADYMSPWATDGIDTESLTITRSGAVSRLMKLQRPLLRVVKGNRES
jgi:CelD/BcsL family acetyltransferase involved in cellulose biosynthesis